MQNDVNISSYLWVIIPVAVLIIWIAAAYLWNRKIVPRQRSRGRATATFNDIMGRTIKFVLKEDTQVSEKIAAKQPGLAKFLVWRNIYILLLALTIILAFFSPGLAIVTGIILFIAIATRTHKVFVQRRTVLMRMFEVAANQLRYPKDANLAPWRYVRIKKWAGMTSPGETHITFPASYRGDDMRNRDAFERHFNGTVTEDNLWSYKWETTKSVVVASPVDHVPEKAQYPGSDARPWNEFPLGLGINGEVIWDITKVPHMLVTGTTGSGKSVVQRNLIFHTIQHPTEWRFFGIDLKKVELSAYKKYDNVVVAIATELEDALEICRYVNQQMQDRYQLLQDLGLNNFADLPPDKKDYALMLMVDEAYELLSPTNEKTDEGKERDALKGEAFSILASIARLGRAAGVFLVLAAQRPDAKVIQGEFKQNLAARIAAGRADSIASNMTLDNDEATRLPGHIKGRGYFQAYGNGQMFQGYFADQSWIDEWLAGEHRGALPATESKPSKKKSLPAKKEKSVRKEDSSDTPKKRGLLGRIEAMNANAQAKHGDTLEESPLEAPESPPLENVAAPLLPPPTRDKAEDALRTLTPASDDEFIDPFSTETSSAGLPQRPTLKDEDYEDIFSDFDDLGKKDTNTSSTS